MQDGTKYKADRNGQVRVAERHASAIKRGWYGQAGVMVATEQAVIATKTTQWCNCTPGGRAWQAWTTTCPRCGAPTTKDKA